MAAQAHPPGPFRHEALFYSGQQEYVRKTGDFIEAAVAADEPILVVVDAEKIRLLRKQLGRRAARVQFADMAAVGLNPGRIIPAWVDFVTEHRAPGRRLRGIGEPIWPERAGEELVECQRHEALLNLAFENAEGFWLLCPYDVDQLDPAVLDEARNSHAFILDGAGNHESPTYSGAQNPRLVAELPTLGEPSVQMRFGPGSLGAVRKLVGRCAGRAGLAPERIADAIFAANEVATNSIQHGGGSGHIRVWHAAGALTCEVSDRGHVDHPLSDRVRPSQGARDPRGLWLANHLCDLLQLRTFADHTVVRLHVRGEPPPA